jgi:hypothetical protein
LREFLIYLALEIHGNSALLGEVTLVFYQTF